MQNDWVGLERFLHAMSGGTVSSSDIFNPFMFIMYSIAMAAQILQAAYWKASTAFIWGHTVLPWV